MWNSVNTPVSGNFMTDLWHFIQSYWTYILGGCAAVAYLFDKGYTIWTDRKKKKQAYNRVFSAIIKTYYSYLKYKMFYSERSPLNIPDKVLNVILKHSDTFKQDLENFKSSIFAEAEIIPEITFQAHHLFDTLDRLSVFDKIKAANDQGFDPLSEQDELIIKRAQLFALEETFDNFFTDIIDEVKKHTSVSKRFAQSLLKLNTDEFRKENQIEQLKIVRRYIDSLKRQGKADVELSELENLSKT